jgi:hypothetical protein
MTMQNYQSQQTRQYIPNCIALQRHIPDFTLPGHTISMGEFLTLTVVQSIFAIEIGDLFGNSPTKQILGYHLKIGHDILSHTSICHSVLCDLCS